MNNNQINFDPLTGQPINQNNMEHLGQISPENVQSVPTVVSTDPVQTIQPVPTIDNTTNIQQQMQNIPTVEQSKQDFINNTQSNSIVQKEEKKKDGPNIAFIAILFVIIFAAIFFLFPYLLKVLG